MYLFQTLFPEAEVFNFEFFIFDRTVFVDCFMNRLCKEVEISIWA
jgi:hypothetical protein